MVFLKGLPPNLPYIIFVHTCGKQWEPWCLGKTGETISCQMICSFVWRNVGGRHSHFSQIAWWMEQNRISKLGRRWIPWSHQNSMANWYWWFFVMGLVRASHGFARIVTSEVVNILNMPWRFSPSCLRVCQVPVPSPACGANHILEILNLIPKNQYPLVN